MFVCSFRLKLKLIQRKARTISSRHIVNNLLRHFSLPLLSNMKMNPNLVFSILPPCIFFFSLSCARAGPCYREKGGDRKMVKSTRETQIFFAFSYLVLNKKANRLPKRKKTKSTNSFVLFHSCVVLFFFQSVFSIQLLHEKCLKEKANIFVCVFFFSMQRNASRLPAGSIG